MKHLILFSTIAMFSATFMAQNIKRDPEPRKDFANVFYKQQYTLFDLWSDEPIFPDKNGIYTIYYATNEDKTPKSFSGSAYSLHNMPVYKFKDYSNCKNWCDGVKYQNKN